MTKNDKLLNEQTLRRWAKLADISVINQNLFINEATEVTEEEETEEETVAEEVTLEEEPVVELEEAEHEDKDMDMAGEEEDMDMDMEVDAEPEAEENDVVMAILKALEPFGVEMDSDEGDEEEEPAMAHGDKEDPAMDHGMKDDPAMGHEPGMGDYGNRQDEDELTEAVLKRVLDRISKLDK
jgi:hypothetical protein|tara:strand:- start:1548 stop:2093 length:546 start_codon:yes stop_codon:yes gene_type:complete